MNYFFGGCYIGKTPEEYKRDNPGRNIRILYLNSRYTMDIRKDRVNLVVSKETGKIVRVWHG